MCRGMDRFQPRESRGLEDVRELSEYCYFVAGVVGEMLTELFCDSSPAIEARRKQLEEKTVSFGLGLQMTNILKDIWEDLERGFCWLPRELFAARGFDLDDLDPELSSSSFEQGLGDLIAIAHGHLRNALEYVLLIPSGERGIRRFCLWALGMAVLTLRKIDRKRGFRSGSEVKITRRTVKATVFASNVSTGNDRMLRWLFAACAAGLPGPRRTEVVIP
jgi:farnesyl-diphosphate farnesyltransferase